MYVLTLLQKRAAESNPAAEIGELIFYGGIAILLVVLVVSGLIVREAWRHRYVNPGAVGLLLFCSVLIPMIVLQLTVFGFLEPGMVQSVVVIGGIVTWLGTLVWYTITSSRMKKRDIEAEEEQRRAELRRAELAPDADLADDGGSEVPEIDAEDAAPAAVPRRAVSIPNADSDVSRASEQTLKRMSLEKLEQTATENKAPRASEVDGNPILPDGLVKIRCLDCYKKMQADGAKFAKQRRCPACKAAPFRFKIESS